jgi:hypothetical protein
MSKTLFGRSAASRRRLSGALALVLFANLLACTEYVPVRGTVDPSAQPAVRVTLTDQGTIDVAPRIGMRAETLEGVLQSVSDSSLAMSVQKVSREGGIEDSYAGEPLTLLPRDYESVAKARTSVARSLVLAGGIIAGAFLLARGAGDLVGGDSGGHPTKTN